MWLEIRASDRQLRLVETEGSPSLEYMQEFVGGLVTALDLYRYPNGRILTGWSNDEGLLEDGRQSVILPGLYPDNSGIRGNFLICATDPTEGKSTSLTRQECEAFQLYAPSAPLSTIHFGAEVIEIGQFPFVPTLRLNLEKLKG